MFHLLQELISIQTRLFNTERPHMDGITTDTILKICARFVPQEGPAPI